MNSYTKIIVQKELIEAALNNFSLSINSQIYFYPNDIMKMLKYIHDHLFESTLTVEKVKSQCGFTNNNITTKFRYNVGLGPREYIIKKRLEAVAELLYENDISIFLIAESIGYTEEAFAKTFKKTYGESPLVYRQKLQVKSLSTERELDKKFG